MQSPDGAYLLSSDGLPGDYEDGYENTFTLWDTKTGTPQALGERLGALGTFSPDSKRIVATIRSAGDDVYDQAVKLLSVPDLKEAATIPLPAGFVTAWPCAFVSGGSVLVMRIEKYEKKGD